MKFKIPKNNEKFRWTNHAIKKMIFYGLSEQRIRRVLNRPDRTEEGIAPNTVACMQIAGSKKRRQEIWVMYQPASVKASAKQEKLKIISAWRYPGKSPTKNPIPQEILEEIKNLV